MSGEVTDNHKVVFMFEFVKKVSEILKKKEHISSKCVIRNLSWSIVIERKSTEGEGSNSLHESDSDNEFECVGPKETLSVKLRCGGESKLWCSYAKVRLILVSQKEGIENYSREFENLFSSSSSVWGYSDFFEWPKIINPENGFVKDNVLKLQAHVIADIPRGSEADRSGKLKVEHVVSYYRITYLDEMPDDINDWLHLFETNLNDQIVGRISSEFIRMNQIIEKSMKNEEVSEKIIGSAVGPISGVIRTEIQALEKNLEKFCANHIKRVVRDLKNISPNENESSGSGLGDVYDRRGDYESKNSSEKKLKAKTVSTVEEETVPVSVLKMMKELIVEQQRTSIGWVPTRAAAAYYRSSNELRAYQPDSDEYRPHSTVLHPLVYDNNSSSPINSSNLQSENLGSETKRGNTDSSYPNVYVQQSRKNESKQLGEGLVENDGDELSDCTNKTKTTKPLIVPEDVAPLTEQLEKEILFVGKCADGKVDAHTVSDPQKLLELSKKYKNYKIFGNDEF